MLLVRHAKAGHRRDWKGDDRERPLSHAGASQARKLVPVLSPLAPARLLSSPYTRCVQTLEPLAKPLRLKVEKLEEFYRRLWSMGAPGVEVPLKVLHGTDVRDVRIRSIDRLEFIRKKPTI